MERVNTFGILRGPLLRRRRLGGGGLPLAADLYETAIRTACEGGIASINACADRPSVTLGNTGRRCLNPNILGGPLPRGNGRWRI